MRYSYLRTLLLLPLVFLVLNCTGNTAPNDSAEKLTYIGEYDALNDAATDNLVIQDQSDEVIPVQHLELAESYVGTTELTGNNDGLEVEQFLRAVNLDKGNPYCAAFVSFILDETPNIREPDIRSGLASKFITEKSIDAKQVIRGVTDIPPGSIVVWRKGNTIFGHTGFVKQQTGPVEFVTIEANTKPGTYGNQRDGDGVWERERTIQPGNHFRITNFTLVQYRS